MTLHQGSLAFAAAVFGLCVGMTYVAFVNRHPNRWFLLVITALQAANLAWVGSSQ
jgi:hypothetical protein